jgi:hypothetical protein
MFPLIFLIQPYELPPIMIAEVDVINSMKISSEFAARLSRLNSRQTIRVIVFLQISTENPQKYTEEIQKIAETKLDDIRPILAKHQGETLSERPNIFGSIGITITVAGVYALAESSSVKMIVEDQAIFSR